MPRIAHTLRAVVVVLALGPAGRAGAHTLLPAADAQTNTASPDAPAGALPGVFVGDDGVGGLLEGYLKFDLSVLPPGTLVAKASLRLWVDSVPVPGAIEVRLVTSAWDEATLTANTNPSASTLPLAALSLAASAEQHWVTVDLTPVAAAWVSGVNPNHGLLLAAAPGASPLPGVRFDSKENALTSHPAELEVLTVPPEGAPGSGDITALIPGPGLTGGGVAGNVTLSASFAGSGAASTVARSDHYHFGSLWNGNNGTLDAFSVYNSSTSPNVAAITAWATGASGRTFGLFGRTSSTSSDATGVYGEAAASSGNTVGVWGRSLSQAFARGVLGQALTTTGEGYGVWGESASTGEFAAGVLGISTPTAGDTTGVWGRTNSSGARARAVYGEAVASSGAGTGVWGVTFSTAGRGVYGEAIASTGDTSGVWGRTRSNGVNARGVYGEATATTGGGSGLYGRSSSASGRGVYGENLATAGTAAGVYGRTASVGSNARGVYGEAVASTGTGYGVFGVTQSTTKDAAGVYGQALASSGVVYGVFGRTSSNTAGAVGVFGQATGNNTSHGVWGDTAAPGGVGAIGLSHATTGVGRGVFGRSMAAAGAGGWFENLGGGFALVVQGACSGCPLLDGERARRAPAGSLIATSAGAYLSPGGAWVNSSDVQLKENFGDVDGAVLLARLAALPIRSWNYKSEGRAVRHLGPTAQDFAAAFGLGADALTIATVDAAGVALAAVQQLQRALSERQAEVEDLRGRLQRLERRLAGEGAAHE